MKIDVDFEIFGILAFYSAILLAKILVMPVLVAKQRINKKVSVSVDESTCSGSTAATDSSEVFANPEDKAFVPGGEVSIKHTDQDVERYRRAHLNDLENILPFIFLATLFCFTNPGIEFARCLFQLFTIARIGHTIFYCAPRARKAWLRFASCGVGWVINAYMAFSVFMYNF
ncbi:microsomal glutathione S-transferase 1 isoform X1 [Folsomia candida]|uniref:Microsomal glutathione S-transferase 1 n=1 Tax=Folsomia candida TaxID=158441 RepID=A0A226ER72_FOLCA|nr:microsomal glutathione S-transferase 1 isoform X1 [Folsomia candida]OXA60009.1 Microsomal glutathione S-transferase 1 [Folsomia candida]